MDQITIDLTDIPEACVGDSVTLIGEDGGACQSADRLGEEAGTISYDVLTGLLPRVPRLFVHGGGVVGVTPLDPSPPSSSLGTGRD
jgi:alanine racemase